MKRPLRGAAPRNRLLALALAATAVGLSAPAAHADLFTLSSNMSGDLTGNVTFNNGTTNLVGPVDAYIGPATMTVTDTTLSPPLIVTVPGVYCISVFQDYSNNGSYTLTTGLGSLASPSVQQEILNSLVGAYGAGSTPNTLSSTQEAALQTAIWAETLGLDLNPATSGASSTTITGGTSTLTIGLGTSTKDSANNFVYYLTEYLSDANTTAPGGTLYQFVPANPANNQPFAYVAIGSGGYNLPMAEPASLAVLGVGLLGLGVLRRRSHA